jgi:tannase/feruloyl esterase
MRKYFFAQLQYVLFAALAALPGMAGANAPCTMATFAPLGLTNTVLLKVESLPAGANPSPVGTIDAPICRVYAVFDQRTVGGAVLGDFFEVWLPTTSWNGKYQGAGNGGLAGSITYSDMRAAVSRGYATSSTDTGHSSNAASNPWWTDAPAIKDYGYRAIHETALRSKAIIQAFYGSAPSLSYFNACSTGGREAFMEAQRYPTDYDGIIAGSPVYRVIKLRARHVHTWQCNYLDTSNAHAIPVSKLRPIFDAIVAQCDAIDGLVDGQVDDPRRCHFDPASIQCAGADDGKCLTAAQVETFRCIYKGATDPNTGEVIYPGPPLTSELDEAQNIGQAPNTQYTTFFANTVFENPAYDFLTFRFPGDVTFSLNKVYGGETLEFIHHAESPDLRAFSSRGGKFIIWHGWSDPLPQPIDSIAYYEKVDQFYKQNSHGKDKTRVEDFVRLFILPNVGHCGGGSAGGPNTFDAVTALEQWVEHGVAPEKMIASRVNNGVVTRTRPICAYPNRAVYKGQGSIDDAANFVCKKGGWEDGGD